MRHMRHTPTARDHSSKTMSRSKHPVDHRRAQAGCYIFEGMKLGPALERAGFSPWTAKAAKRNGINESQCLEAARHMELVPDSATIRNRARRVLDKKLQTLEDSTEELKKTRAGEVARIVEVTERYHGDKPSRDDVPVRDFVDRMEWVVALQQELDRRRARQRKTDDALGSDDVLDVAELPALEGDPDLPPESPE